MCTQYIRAQNNTLKSKKNNVTSRTYKKTKHCIHISQNAGNKQNTKYINQYSWYRKRLQVLYKCRKQIQKEFKSLYKCRKQIQKSSSNYISTENRYNSGKNINSRSTLPLPIYVKIVSHPFNRKPPPSWTYNLHNCREFWVFLCNSNNSMHLIFIPDQYPLLLHNPPLNSTHIPAGFSHSWMITDPFCHPPIPSEMCSGWNDPLLLFQKRQTKILIEARNQIVRSDSLNSMRFVLYKRKGKYFSGKEANCASFFLINNL